MIWLAWVFPRVAPVFGLLTAFAPSIGAGPIADLPAKPRLIVMADMGNEPDEVQQMLHLLMYANRIDIEGLIACSGKYLHADRTDGRTETRPELFHQLIDAYALVRDRLETHEPGWPKAQDLRAVVKSGTAKYGLPAVEPGHGNEASRLIEASLLKDDPRPLYLVCNAGANTLAQALVDVAEGRSPEAMTAICEKIIVFENGAQDHSGAWIAGRFPAIRWHRSNRQTYSYGGPGPANGPYTWEPFSRDPQGQHTWAEEHIVKNHGPLGALYPRREFNGRLHYIEGGGTVPWLGLTNRGLTDPERLWWGGWSGRFSRERQKNVYSRHQDIRPDEHNYKDFTMFASDSEEDVWTDQVYGETFAGPYVPVWRFRRAMMNDFRARMDWCVLPYEEANHPPTAALGEDRSDAIVRRSVRPGERVELDASRSTDPDGDAIRVRWEPYPEAGTYSGELTVADGTATRTTFAVPADAAGTEIHLLLLVNDESPIVPLTDYRRLVLTVSQ
ncbi:MAG: nucleoside hydrolase-like domain-containing protein [Planctomycetota bacterium]